MKTVSSSGFEEDKENSEKNSKSQAVNNKSNAGKSKDSTLGPSEDQMDKKGDKEEEKPVEFEQSERFNSIVDEIRFANMAKDILKSIDFKDLQSKLLEILARFLSLKTNRREDRVIICSALELWTASVIENQDMIDEFYTWERKHAPEHDSSSISIETSEKIIVTGIYTNKGDLVRNTFKTTLELLCEKVTTNKGKRPLFYIIEVLERHFPNAPLNDNTKIGDSTWSTLRETIMKDKDDYKASDWFAKYSKEEQITIERLIELQQRQGHDLA